MELAYGFTLTVPDSERPANPEPACQVYGELVRFHQSLRQDPRKRHAAEAVGPPDMTRFAAASG